MGLFKKTKNAIEKSVYKMIVDTGNGFYAWNGKLYQSDIVRSCIRPRTKAVGKLKAKHVRETEVDGKSRIEINPKPYIRAMLKEPNQFMGMQMLLEKTVNQLSLNGNAFILIIRDSFGLPCGLYPITCSMVESKYINNNLHLKFTYLNGKSDIFPYSEIIHLRDDFFFNDIFGENPAEGLASLMNMVGTIDNGMINAVRNGGLIRWLLKFTQSMREEDLDRNAQKFADRFLSIENSTGVAAVDAKAEAQQITPNDYVPNAIQTDRITKRIYDFYGVNDKIVSGTYTEDEWISYYESVIEPIAEQLSEEFTRKLFTRNEQAYGNSILFESSNLTFASMQTKLSLVNLVDRGIMTPNEVRYYFNLAPIEGGDEALLRKDTGKLKGGEGDEEN